jgi:hypothetical protein
MRSDHSDSGRAYAGSIVLIASIAELRPRFAMAREIGRSPEVNTGRVDVNRRDPSFDQPQGRLRIGYIHHDRGANQSRQRNRFDRVSSFNEMHWGIDVSPLCSELRKP